MSTTGFWVLIIATLINAACLLCAVIVYDRIKALYLVMLCNMEEHVQVMGLDAIARQNDQTIKNQVEVLRQQMNASQN